MILECIAYAAQPVPSLITVGAYQLISPGMYNEMVANNNSITGNVYMDSDAVATKHCVYKVYEGL